MLWIAHDFLDWGVTQTFTIAMLVWAFDFAHAVDPITKSPIPVDIHAYNSVCTTAVSASLRINLEQPI